MPPKHGYAALAREDVADARRAAPAVDLTGYAESRGMQMLGSKRTAGYRGGQPYFDDYLFNVMRGPHDALWHELMEVSPSTPGLNIPMYAKVQQTPGWWKPRLPDRHDIPILGEFLDSPTDPTPLEPFENDSLWIPITTAATHAWGPAAALTPFYIEPKGQGPKGMIGQHHEDLPGGWRLTAPEPMNFPGFSPPWSGDARYTRVHVIFGTVILQRNGFVADETTLDGLRGAAWQLARALEQVYPGRPRPFSDALPGWTQEVAEELPVPWFEALRAYGQQLGMAEEDPDSYHDAFPALPVPGRAMCVLRGAGIPGTNVPGRLAFHAERPVHRGQLLRPVVLFATDAADTSVHADGFFCDVSGGIATCWSTWAIGIDIPAIAPKIADQVAALRARGLAPV